MTPFNPINLPLLLQLIGLAIGLTYVIVGSVIGYRIRLIVCLICWWRPLRFFWYLVQCPPCNAWWTGAATGFIAGLPLTNILQIAFTTCGIMALIQARLGGSGIAADEDMEQILGEVFNGKEAEGSS